MKLFVVILYFLAVLGIGVAGGMGRFRIKREDDYNLGGRAHGWFAVSMSAMASACSAFAFVGMAGLSYNVGISMLWYSLLATTWSWGVFFILGKRLRIISERTNTITVIDYIGERFEDKKLILRTVATIIVALFMLGYVGSQLRGIAKSFQAFLNWPFMVGILLGTGVVVVYTILSGFRAVVWSDVLQGIVMMFGSLLLMVLILVKAGGLTSFLEMAAKVDPKLTTVTGGKVGIAFATFLLSWIGSGVMGLGNPHVVVRPMAMRDWRKLRQAGILALIGNMWVMYLGVFAGLAARVWLPVTKDVDLAYGMVVDHVMGPFLGGIIIAGVIAAAMSTVDSQLLVGATEIARNIYAKLFNPQASQDKRIWMTRIWVAIIGIGGVILALTSQQIVFWMVLFAWAGLGCSFGPLLILSLYWKRMTWAGAFAGMVAGTVTVIIWNQTAVLKRFIYEGVPGFIVAFIVILIVSLLPKPPEKAEEFLKI
jgi:sodium/proline symporter